MGGPTLLPCASRALGCGIKSSGESSQFSQLRDLPDRTMKTPIFTAAIVCREGTSILQIQSFGVITKNCKSGSLWMYLLPKLAIKSQGT